MSRLDLQPIFIFSLPRSGSTLLQRILATHASIATTSEPWFLLPHLFPIGNSTGVYACYSHATARNALIDFYNEMPNGLDDYLAELHQFALTLYRKVTTEPAIYFLDKTPRYHLIVEEIIQLFPESKFIFLWRNPLGIVASIIETWMNGKWHIHRYKVDLYEGLKNLTTAYIRHQDKAFSISYEDLLLDPERQIRKVCEYLHLDYDAAMLDSFTQVRLAGKYGDPKGTKLYKTLNQESLDKWKSVLNNPIRKAWCIRYLKWIGPKQLTVMGYNLDHLISEIKSVPFSFSSILYDFATSLYGVLYSVSEPQIIKQKIKNWPRWDKIYYHN